MSSSQEKKRLIRRVRALKRALKRQAEETSAPPEAAPSEPENTGGTGGSAREPSGLRVRTELLLEGQALRRPHLFGFDQTKREALGVKALHKVLNPETPDRVMLSAMRNCLTMESLEQALAAKEADREVKQPEQPQQPVNVNLQVNQTVSGAVSPLDLLYDRIMDARQSAVPTDSPRNGAGQSGHPPRANGQTG